MTLTQINKAGLDEIALDHVFTIGASGSSAYTFQGEGLNGTVNNPTLYLTRGKTYRFENGSGGHPIRIQSTSGASGTAYNTGVTNNAGSGTVIVEVQHDAPDVLYYQCTSHAAMNGILYITGALADDGVTTAKLADDAVTSAKLGAGAVDTTALGADAVTAAKIADDAVNSTHLDTNAVTTDSLGATVVTTAKIADDAVTFEKIENITANQVLGRVASGTGEIQALSGAHVRGIINVADGATNSPTITINNNADNRVITGSGTANTLNAESNVFIDANGKLGVGTTGPDNELQVQKSNAGGDVALRVTNATGTDAGTTASLYLTTSPVTDFNTTYLQAKRADGSFNIGYGTNTPNVTVLGASGKVGINKTTPTFKLDVEDSTDNTFRLGHSGETGHGSHNVKIVGGRNYYHNLRFEGSNYYFYGFNGSNTAEHFRIRSTGGVTFNGDSGDANALDDYEEGLWTPGVIQGTVQYSGNKYTKIGRLVYVQAYLHSFSNTSSGSTVEITGLPFTGTNTGMAVGATMYAYINDSNKFIIYHDGNNRLLFYGVYSGNYNNLTHNQLSGSNANIHLFATYQA